MTEAGGHPLPLALVNVIRVLRGLPPVSAAQPTQGDEHKTSAQTDHENAQWLRAYIAGSAEREQPLAEKETREEWAERELERLDREIEFLESQSVEQPGELQLDDTAAFTREFERRLGYEREAAL